MQLSDTVILDATPDRVWATLVDAHAIGSCIPGVQEVEIYDGGRSFGGEARINLGATSLSFPARATWIEQDAPYGGRLRASVTPMGHEISAVSTMRLQANGPGKTTMAWQVDVELPPELAGNVIVMQMAKPFAQRFIRAFFECVQTRLAPV